MPKKLIYLPLIPFLVVLILFFVFPLLTVLNNSYLDKQGSFTLVHYIKFLTDPYYLNVLFVTFKISIIVTVITLLLGYAIAYYVTKVLKSKLAKRIAYVVIISPIFTSAVVRSFGWIVILGNNGFINQMLLKIGLIDQPIQLLYNETGIIIGLIYILAPFMILSLTSVLQSIDSRLDEAAADLGYSRWKSFIKVTLPLSVPGILSGVMMVFSLSLSSYVTPALISGGKIKVLAMLIYEQMTQLMNWQFGGAMSFVMLVVSIVILMVNNYLLKTRWSEGGRS
ncbi:putative spermidine/putrescine transport system permease protein [Seinonella peptonophila]|uniref:Putative spermidine/putrescine transport system permease protein n=1 Tax=Seinonella peptonophila TaxID=112248 RepID=A0A1M5BKR7_9BACL|nr:ABC transporter permease [Seinonella peptonophila]SHF42847.1 putative spermidine/putrescine transport system permease protein [Seinonella peptonophila]